MVGSKKYPGPVHGPAARHRGRAVRQGVGDQLLDPLELRLVVDRAQLDALLGALADLDRRRLGGQRLDHVVVERLGDVDPLDGGADLAVVDERPAKMAPATTAGSASSSTIAGSLPPSSRVTRFRSGAADTATFLPGLDRAGEADLARHRVRRHPGAQLVAAAHAR